MLLQDKENKLIALFCEIDDFCLALRKWKEKEGLTGKTTRSPQLSESEIMTISVFCHYSGYKCFQYFYQQQALPFLKSYFPGLPSYERFLSLLPRVLPGLYLFLLYQTHQSCRTGIYFIDSKKIVVSHNQRIHSNRVFRDFAKRGKSSTGWFYGLTLHLVINNLGQICQFLLTPANVADNSEEVLKHLLSDLQGECYGDKGYLSRFFGYFYERGLTLVTRIKNNMKNKLLFLSQRIRLRKRAIIESVNDILTDILTSVFDIEHSRHRSQVNAVSHLFAGLIAYCFYENKPSVFFTTVPQFISRFIHSSL
jgi:hypothetical protein